MVARKALLAAVSLMLVLGAGGCSCNGKDISDDPAQADAGTALERPGALPRPPSGGLPDELRPPR